MNIKGKREEQLSNNQIRLYSLAQQLSSAFLFMPSPSNRQVLSGRLTCLPSAVWKQPSSGC